MSQNPSQRRFVSLSLEECEPRLALSTAPITDYNGDGRSDIAFHRPGGPWNTVPTLRANGNGTWQSTNAAAPSWANQPGVVSLPGDYNGDGRTDIAFHRPGSDWASVPVLLSNSNGTWNARNFAAPIWANQPGVIALLGDYNRDGRDDIAFHRPGGGWSSVPVLFARGDGSWTSTNAAVPIWANQSSVVAVPGDYNRDGRGDVAFLRPGSDWSSVPVLFANGNGTWSSANFAVPTWANQRGVVPIPGDFNRDGRGDIALHRPGGGWSSVPVLLANGNGSWSTSNFAVPSWANEFGAIALPGDYNNDGRTDVAFHKPWGSWSSVPVLFAAGNGSWGATNFGVPVWANQTGAVAVTGDYNRDGRSDIAFHRPGRDWNTVPILFANGNGTWGNTNAPAPTWANESGVRAVDRDARLRQAIMFVASPTGSGSGVTRSSIATSDALFAQAPPSRQEPPTFLRADARVAASLRVAAEALARKESSPLSHELHDQLWLEWS